MYLVPVYLDLARTCVGSGHARLMNALELHYGKMAAVSVMRMRTGSYTHIIVLINFGIP